MYSHVLVHAALVVSSFDVRCQCCTMTFDLFVSFAACSMYHHHVDKVHSNVLLLYEMYKKKTFKIVCVVSCFVFVLFYVRTEDVTD